MPDAAVTSPWLTPTEAAAYLRFPSVAALRKAVQRGQVPAHRRGNRVLLFDRRELDDELLKR
jgi:excisionase family DNA binding protein